MNKFQKVIVCWCSVLILSSILLLLGGCPLWGSPNFDFTIENQTQEVLTISVNTGSGIEVKPREKITEKYLIDTGKFNIIAKNLKGDIIYSKEFTYGELDDMKFIVIIK
jgi:hypothetical protein